MHAGPCLLCFDLVLYALMPDSILFIRRRLNEKIHDPRKQLTLEPSIFPASEMQWLTLQAGAIVDTSQKGGR